MIAALSLCGDAALFLLVVLGLGWPLASRLRCDPAEKLLAGAVISLLAAFLLAWCAYVFALHAAFLWTPVVLALLGLLAGRAELMRAWRDAAARSLMASQALVTAWCVGWLATVLNYSGGTWAADWFGHWQRADFFVRRGPPGFLFNGFDPVASRPPLANVVGGAAATWSGGEFADYQLAAAVFASLAFLPAALLARRAGGERAVRVLAALFLFSPLVAQNATFTWTKLPAAFFTLAAVHWFLEAGSSRVQGAGLLCAAAVAGSVLTHYSAGPYAVVLVAAWVARGRGQRWDRRFWASSAAAALLGAALLSAWFGWTLRHFGVEGTLLSNSSVTDAAPTAGEQLRVAALNLRDTVVPYVLRDVNPRPFLQESRLGAWRDAWFQLHQVSLLPAFGIVGWLAVLAAARRAGKDMPRRRLLAWAACVMVVVVLGVAVHGGRDRWGLAHICLQPLVLAGLALLASRWEALGPAWRSVAAVGAAADLAFGIVLQFACEGLWLERLGGASVAEAVAGQSRTAMINALAKAKGGWRFVGEDFASATPAVLAALALLLVVALRRARARS